jgi:hypothetical protein
MATRELYRAICNRVYPPTRTDAPCGMGCPEFRTGAVFQEGTSSIKEIRVWGISHPAIVLPLTAICEFVLLTGPRQSAGKTITESIQRKAVQAMREFFNGWRRKIGMMTLVLALMFMELWGRSHSVKDLWGFGSGQEKAVLGLTTFPGEFRWQRQEFDREAFYRVGWYCRAYDTSELAATDDVVSPSGKLEWRWRRLGFDFGAATLNATSYAAPGYYAEGVEVPQDPEEPNLKRVVFWTIPFYSIVLPLTAVSAFLLIFKPRQSLPRKIVDSIAPAPG